MATGDKLATLDVVKAVKENCVSKSGDTITGDIYQTSGTIYGSTNSTLHGLKLGHSGDDVMNFLEPGGEFNFIKTSTSGQTDTTVFQVKNGTSAYPLPVNNGGTGATTASSVRSNLQCMRSDTTQYSAFSQIPEENGVYQVYIAAETADADGPISTAISNSQRYQVIQTGVANRRTQIATTTYNTPEIFYYRHQHDDTWSSWYKLDSSAINVRSVTFTGTTNSGGGISVTEAAGISSSKFISVDSRTSNVMLIYLGNGYALAINNNLQKLPDTSVSGVLFYMD